MIQCLRSLPLNLPSLSSLSERSTCGVNRDGNLAIEDNDLGVLGNSEKAQSMADLWMIRDETEQSFVRRQSTELFSLVFGGSCLLLPSPCSRDDLTHEFISSSDCQR